MLWDVFCHVIDNLGDVGVCWRLAADLGRRGEQVRLWLTDPAPLAWMAPDGAAGVEVLRWSDPLPGHTPGDVVIEAFGCTPPPAFVGRMAARPRPPLWINLEYLSAEAYVERSHGLRSPQAGGPGAGLDKWFFYPGFTPTSGGLLREQGLLAERAGFDRDRWLQQRGWARRSGERVVVLFCYDDAELAALAARLTDTPTLLLAAPGAAQRSLARVPMPASLRSVALPWLAQPDFDRLLWCADLNLVRGEDSFVRAQWAGAPFVWQIYAQSDGAHVVKLDAFVERFIAGAGLAPPDAAALHALFRAWNGLGRWPARLPEEQAWRRGCERWRAGLLGQTDLTTRLLRFTSEKR